MKSRHFLLLSFLGILAITGCMQTRHVETTCVSTCSAGPCASASHDATCSERRWCGFWVGQPARVQP